MTERRFRVNGQIFTVREYNRSGVERNSRYTCRVGRFTQTGYTTSPGCHKAVLLSFLDDAGRAGAISHETANWSEGAIRYWWRGRWRSGDPP